MQQQKTNWIRFQEYPGSCWHEEYDLICPCGKIAGSLIEEKDDDGDFHMLCPKCAEEAEKEFQTNANVSANP